MTKLQIEQLHINQLVSFNSGRKKLVGKITKQSVPMEFYKKTDWGIS